MIMSKQANPVTFVTKFSHDGRGIAAINGKTTFIDGALPNEEVSFIYTSRKSKYDEAKLNEVLKPSPLRAEPQCQHFTVCGGCSMQHIAPEAQIQLKQQMLLEQLSHFGGAEPDEILPPLTGPVWGYRRKARLGAKHVVKKGKVLVGFREKNGRYLADIERCEVLHPKVGTLITQLQALIANLVANDSIPQIEMAMGDDECALVFRHMEPLGEPDLAQLKAFAAQHQLQFFLQPGGVETIHPLWPEQPKPLSYTLPDFNLTLYFQPADFTQVNIAINRRMVSHALTLLAPTKEDRVLDLFCGLGNFTLPLATLCKEVVGVEGDGAMVTRGYENAALNNITNASFYAANLAEDFSGAAWAKQGFDKILLDPPRTGALELIQYLPAFGASRIVYVSCNPATLARDAGMLANQGYRLTKVGVMDMFPHTRHVESIAVFEKTNKLKQI